MYTPKGSYMVGVLIDDSVKLCFDIIQTPVIPESSPLNINHNLMYMYRYMRES